jgi:hypothetical protein
MNFNDYKNAATTASETGLSFYTGITPFKVLLINPTEEQLSEYLGEYASKFTNYEKVENREKMVRPINLWLTDINENINPFPVTISVGEDDVVYSTGSRQFINKQMLESKRQDLEAYKETLRSDTSKYGWMDVDSFRAAKIGQYEWYKLVAQLFRFDFKSDFNFFKFLEDNKLDTETIFDGDFEGLHQFVKYLNDNNNYFFGIAAVRDNGEKKRQTIVRDPETYMRSNVDGEVTDGMKDYIKKRHDQAYDNGRSLSSALYTINSTQRFKAEECVNNIPEEPTSATSWV